MKPDVRRILKKDLRAERAALALYVLGVGGVEYCLATLTLPKFGFLLQLLLWVFGGAVFALRCREDPIFRVENAWWVTRPIVAADIAAAKWWFATLAIVAPPLFARVALGVILGYDSYGIFAGALAGAAPPILVSLAVMNRLFTQLARWRWVTPATLACTAFVLAVAKTVSPETTDRLAVQTIDPSASLPPLATVVDPWMSVRLPPKRVLLSGSFECDLSVKRVRSVPEVANPARFRYFGVDRFRIRGSIEDMSKVSPASWYWYFTRQHPESAVYQDSGEHCVPLRWKSEKKTRTRTPDGEYRFVYRSAPLPDGLDGATTHIDMSLRWRVAEVRRVWSGTLTDTGLSSAEKVPAHFQTRPGGRLELSLTAPVATGLSGDGAFYNWFGNSAAILVSGTNGERRHSVVLHPRWRTIDAGFPAFARRYRLRFRDPRRYFPPGAKLAITLYSANRDGHGGWSGRRPVTVALPRGQRLERALERGKHAQEFKPTQAAPPPRAVPPQPPPEPPVPPAPPAPPEELAQRLTVQPREFLKVPEERRAEATRVIKRLLRQRPIYNPYAMLQLASAIQLTDEQSRDGLAWCFVHSNRLRALLVSEDAHHGNWPRCPVDLLRLFSESRQEAIWRQTWPRVKLEILTKREPIIHPDYLIEALQRNSPDARFVASVYIRRHEWRGTLKESEAFQHLLVLAESELPSE